MSQMIWAVGRNYAEHAKELGNAVPDKPIIFSKSYHTLVSGDPASGELKKNPVSLPYPASDIHHEVEMAVRISADFKPEAIAVALDLTNRSAQTELKNKGLPWELAKGFKNSCPISDWIPVSPALDLGNIDISLTVNGQLRQSGNTSQMLYSTQQLIDYLRHYFPISAGDILLTGTPPGVGPLSPGAIASAELKHAGQRLISCKWSF